MGDRHWLDYEPIHQFHLSVAIVRIKICPQVAPVVQQVAGIAIRRQLHIQYGAQALPYSTTYRSWLCWTEDVSSTTPPILAALCVVDLIGSDASRPVQGSVRCESRLAKRPRCDPVVYEQ